jgi:glycosyltransferase involved in cell wall biosynthesis
MRMKVLHVYSGNLFGGIESMLLACARVPVEASGIESSFALCFDERLASELRALGRPVHLLGPVTMRRPGTAHAARRALDTLLAQRAFDRIVCHAPWAYALFAGVVRRRRLPLVFWAHDRMAGRHWTERLARHTRPDLVVCNSAFTASTLPALFPGIRSAVIHPPVAKTPALRERRYVRMSLDTDDDAVVIIQASRCEAWKGHRLLLDALSQLADVPRWVWWLAGGLQRDEERDFLAALRAEAERSGLNDRIRWLGDRSDVSTLLAAADLHCQANLEPEPFGVTFVEALAAGLPVVSVNEGGVVEIVDRSCGLLVPSRDVRALADALRTLVDDDGYRHQLASGTQARARHLCDPLTQVVRLGEALAGLGPLEMAG